MIALGSGSFHRAGGVLLGGVALLSLAACSRSGDGDAATATVTGDGKTVTSTASARGGETATVELKLPGGFEARVKGPADMGDHSKIDIDGVGLYPGAKVGGVQVKVDATASKGHRANVDIGFSAKSDPAAVADWYQQQFEAKGIAATRSGDTLTGRSKDGDAFTVTALANKDGGTAGTIAIRDGG